MRLENKIAFITGGTSGIGKATLHRLIKEGAKVVFTGRKEDAGNAIAEETGAIFFKHDVADDKGYKNIAKRIKCCLLYTSPSPRDATLSRMPSSA